MSAAWQQAGSYHRRSTARLERLFSCLTNCSIKRVKKKRNTPPDEIVLEEYSFSFLLIYAALQLLQNEFYRSFFFDPAPADNIETKALFQVFDALRE